MKQGTWLKCHAHANWFFGGVPMRTVCDSLKTGVVKHPRDGEVVLNKAYEAHGLHRGPGASSSNRCSAAGSPPASPRNRRGPRGTYGAPATIRRTVRTRGPPMLDPETKRKIHEPAVPGMLDVLELTEPRRGCTSTIFCTQHPTVDRHGRMGGGTRAESAFDGIVVFCQLDLSKMSTGI